MIVKTKNPIRIISNSKDNYSNIDAKNKDDVRAFQDWLDIKYPNGWITKPDGTKYVLGKNQAKGYGNYGVSTRAAYITDGAEWEKTRPKKDEPKKDEIKKDEITVTKDDKGNTITTTKKADGTILTVVTDKNGKVISKKESGMSKKLKIGLMIGGGVLVLLIIAVIIKQSQK